MADLTSRKKAVDERTLKIRHRRLQHDIHSMEGSIEKCEIDILEVEAQIERTLEQIEATKGRIEEKRLELQALEAHQAERAAQS